MADMEVYVYPNAPADDGIADDAEEGIEIALAEVVESSDISSYDVTVREDYPKVADLSRDDLYHNFNEWRQAEHNLETGLHLCVSTEVGGGRADGGDDRPQDDAFVDPKDAVAGSTLVTTDHFMNTCIQEVFHAFIDNGLPEVRELMGPDDNEHSLGERPAEGTTPMATGYEDRGYLTVGTCSLDQGGSGYTQSPSYCTVEALEATAKDENVV